MELLEGSHENLFTVQPHFKQVLVEVHDIAHVEPLVVRNCSRLGDTPRAVRQRCAVGDLDGRIEPGGKMAGGGFQSGWCHMVGRGVDQVTAEGHAGGKAGKPLPVIR